MTQLDRSISPRRGSAGEPAQPIHFHDLHPTPADMRADVLAGLTQPQKRLAPKYFYDAEGSRLFDAICELPEYYPTRTEIAVLRRHGAAMAARLGRDALLVELGSGSSLKIRVLYPGYGAVDMGDARVRNKAAALAAPMEGSFHGAEVRIEPAVVSLDAPPDTLAREAAGFFYASFVLSPPARRQMLSEIAALFADQGVDGQGRFSMPINRLVVSQPSR